MVVNAHGGLLKLKMKVSQGESIIISNPMTITEQPCRVVHVGNLPDGDTGVAFEFLRPTPEFWPVGFPPEDRNASS
jgi:hypothetical protein